MKSKDELKLLFVNPCLRKNAPTKLLPIGLAHVMTFIKANGYNNINLLDVDIHEYEDDYIKRHIQTHQYDVVLLGSIVTHYKWIKWFANTVKECHPETKVVVGNSVAGSIYDVFLNKCAADVAVIGEGEYSTLEVLESIRSGGEFKNITGIAYRAEDGSIVKNPKRKACKMKELPMVDWDLFDYNLYLGKTAQYATSGVDKKEENKTISFPVSTARGCAFRCTFCHFVFWDDPYRYHTPDRVLQEVKRNMERYGANYINFWDDLSFAAMPQTERMCDAILKSGLKFQWMAAVRADLFGDPKYPYEKRLAVAEKMKRSGCVAVGFSLESGNEDILQMMNKKIEADFFIEQVKILRKVGIVCNTSVVFGYPIETPDTIKQTFDQCLKARVYPSIGFLLPLPYTGMYEYAKKNGHITDEDAYLDSITERQDICLNMTKMTDDEIMSSIKDGARRLNEALELGLSEDRYIRTGGYKKHTQLKDQLKDYKKSHPPLDPDNIKRNENDFSFNYSEAVFEVDDGKKSSC